MISLQIFLLALAFCVGAFGPEIPRRYKDWVTYIKSLKQKQTTVTPPEEI
jgi:hypothetical protein